MTLKELRALCVERFPLSRTRADIMLGLEKAIVRMGEEGIRGRLWVDGSFLTEAINPKDVDVVLVIPRSLWTHAPAALHAAIRRVQDGKLKDEFLVDSYVFMESPESSDMHEYDLGQYELYFDWFGRNRPKNVDKGIVVIDVPAVP
jgi:hypothetical protein